MEISINWLKRQVANSLVLLLLAPLAQAAPPAVRQQASGATGQASRQSGSVADPSQPQQAGPAQRQGPAQPPITPTQPQNAPEPQQAQPTTPQVQQQTTPVQRPDAPEPQQTNTTEPVGTAAAPYENPVGAAVSRPAGAAIAPAKQKRRRSFLIRMGLVIGAAVAIGTVVALSKASPSRAGH